MEREGGREREGKRKKKRTRLANLNEIKVIKMTCE